MIKEPTPIFSLIYHEGNEGFGFRDMDSMRKFFFLSTFQWSRRNIVPTVYVCPKGREIIESFGFLHPLHLVDFQPKMGFDWAGTKLEVYAQAVKDYQTFIHQDFDAFFLRSLPSFEKECVFFQSVDCSSYQDYMGYIALMDDIPDLLKEETQPIYNFGVVGTNSIEMGAQLRKDILEYMEKAATYDSLWHGYRGVLLEQLGVSRLVQKNGYPIDLLWYDDDDRLNRLEDLGYCHLLGERKRDDFWRRRIEKLAEHEERWYCECGQKFDSMVWVLKDYHPCLTEIA